MHYLSLSLFSSPHILYRSESAKKSGSKVRIMSKISVSEELKYKFLFYAALTVLIGLVALGLIEYYEYGFIREYVFVVKSTETAAYDLFDKQFTQLLTVFSILVAVFGLAIPFTAYLIQRETLRDERARMMDDVAAHEKKLYELIDEMRADIGQIDKDQKSQFLSRQKEITAQVEKYIEDKGLYERELSYRLGRHFFLSGLAFPDNTLAKIMSFLHALEQFSLYADYKKSIDWIDTTLANIQMVVEDSKHISKLGVHWSYRLEALQILRNVSEKNWLSPSLRDSARDLAVQIRKVKRMPEEVTCQVKK